MEWSKSTKNKDAMKHISLEQCCKNEHLALPVLITIQTAKLSQLITTFFLDKSEHQSFKETRTVNISKHVMLKD
jgi:hypothetical protein